MKKYNCILSVLVGFLVLACINIFVYFDLEKQPSMSGVEFAEREEYLFTETFKSQEDVLIQYFIPTKSYLDKVKIRLAVNYEDYDTKGWVLSISLKDKTGDVVKETEITTDDFENWKYYTFDIGERVEKKEKYSIEIRQIAGDKARVEQEQWPLSIVCFINPNELEEYEECYFNNNIMDGNIELLLYYIDTDWNSMYIIFIGDAVVMGAFLLLMKRKNRYISKKIQIFLWGLTPIFMFFTTEYMVGNIEILGIKYIIINLLIYYLLYVFMTLIFNKFTTSCFVYCISITIVALVQYYVSKLRGRPFTLFDVMSYKTALAVAGTYEFSMSFKTGICLQMTVLFFVVQYSLQKLVWIKRRKERLIRVLGIVSVLLISSGAVLYGQSDSTPVYDEVNMWNIQSSYDKQGLIYCLFLETQYISAEKPEEYSVKTVEKIAADINYEEHESIQPDNIILIMNESFADLEIISHINTDSQLLPFIRDLTENTVKGWLTVPVFGAGTADSEYEVLTGNTKRFHPGGTTAYQLYCHDPEYGLVTNLKAQGYYATAMHPYNAKNWNRNIVYEQMGFDDFISIENWGDNVKKLRGWMSDEAAYDKIIDLIEGKDGKQFVFLVTMQNHGGYAEGNNGGYTPTVQLKYDQEFPEAETYLSLANESDRALQMLLDYFEDVEENTMIVMFGDHQPAVEEAFYNELFGKNISDLNMEERQMRYKVPYIIWTNYEQRSEENQNMSANYLGSYIQWLAGLELNPYNEFLLQLKEQIPIIGEGAICDSQGKWYDMAALPEKYFDILNQYKILEYNNVFDYNNRVSAVFSLE